MGVNNQVATHCSYEACEYRQHNFAEHVTNDQKQEWARMFNLEGKKANNTIMLQKGDKFTANG